MKLSRNKIIKIRKQEHQSVRKWKKQYKSSARRSTFRQSRRQNMMGVITKYSPKLHNVVNRTLKKYISPARLNELKAEYKRIRQQRRNQKYSQMMGGNTEKKLSPDDVKAIAEITAIVVANVLQRSKDKNNNEHTGNPSSPPNEPSAEISPKAAPAAVAAAAAGPEAAPAAGTEAEPVAAAAVEPESTKEEQPASGDAGDAGDAGDTSSTKSGSKKPLSLGPQINGDITIGTEAHECESDSNVYKLVQFLIEKGLPYYIQIEPKSGDNPLNKNDTNIFDLRRILYGRFTSDIKKIPEKKRKLYIEKKETVGVANGSILGDDQSGFFIYTGEKGQVLVNSTDTAISVRLLQEDPNATPIPSLTDSSRLYKIKGNGPDVKPASIDSMKMMTKLDQRNQIDTSEFRLQVAPMTQDELNKDAQKSSSENTDADTKVVVDESNTYVVNLKVGCKITSIQTLKKSLEKARLSLENEKDPSKKSALDVFKMINALLENSDFAKSDGYDDFKESVFGFSYVIHGSERKYGFTQLQTFFDEKKSDIPRHVIKEFFKLLNLLGHGPGGANGDCLRFNNASQSLYELSRIQAFEEDGKIITKKRDTLDSTSNVNGFVNQLSKIGDTKKNDVKEKGNNNGTDKPDGSNSDGAKSSANGNAESTVAASTPNSAETMNEKGGEGSTQEGTNEANTSTMDENQTTASNGNVSTTNVNVIADVVAAIITTLLKR